jgi:hypothetical protein
MQTIYIDIANKSVLPTIYAKQGDVGRKFRICLTENGVEYQTSSDVEVSIWYEGASGSGNYKDIEDESAIYFDGNKIIVTMIAQMLVNEGDGKICLVLSERDHTEIGTWNIPYNVERRPGIGSKPAQDNHVIITRLDPTLSVEGMAADAAAVGEALQKIPGASDSVTIKDKEYRTEILISAEEPAVVDEDGDPIVGRVGFYEQHHDGAVQLVNIADGTEAKHAATVGQVVLTSAQTLTDEQKRLARENIGAAAVETPRVKAEITYEFRADGAVNKNNKYEAVQDGVNCRYTNLIPVVEGDRFSYYGWSIGENYPNVLWLDKNGNVLTTERWGDIPEGCRLVTVPADVSFVRFCTSNWSSANSESALSANAARFEVCHVAREDEEREIVFDTHVGYYYADNNELVAYASASTKRTNPIPIVPGDIFYFIGGSGTSKVMWYDETGAKISVESGTGKQMVLTPPENAVLVRFISFAYSTNPDKVVLSVSYETKDLNMEQLKCMNYLWGKKYVACGDSFTAGPFDTKTEETWDEATQNYKTYCWHIANRNHMTLVNEAKSGSTMYNKDANSFSVSRYTQVPTDADYVTLCFGLNETSATIGTLSDTTNATIMGAWNVVLDYLIEKMPYAKFGIIIPDAWITAALRDAIIDVAEYWGIPYLDLSGDPKVPLLIGGKRGGATISTRAKELRNAAFQVSSTNEHPNPKAHAYRSTIIENFLRSL